MEVQVTFQGNALDPCQTGKKVASLVEYTTEGGKSDPRIDYGGGYFIHVSTATAKGWKVMSVDTGEQVH